MAATMQFGSLKLDLNAGRASATFMVDALADLPTKGAAVDWVKVGRTGSQVGGNNWYVDNVSYTERGALLYATIEARMPGIDWTWAGLAPLEQRGKWSIIPASKNVSGAVKIGCWNIWTNWSDTDNWTAAQVPTVSLEQKTWIVEFVSTTDYSNTWQGKKNGTWPAGFSPPAGGDAGVYMCTAIKSVLEIYRNPVTGSATEFYRHFATFREAALLPTPAARGTWWVASW